MTEPKPYRAVYRCVRCKHQFEIFQGGFGCPPGRKADPDTPCGRSQRQYRCASCPAFPSCQRCGSLWVEWLNYNDLAKNFDYSSLATKSPAQEQAKASPEQGQEHEPDCDDGE